MVPESSFSVLAPARVRIAWSFLPIQHGAGEVDVGAAQDLLTLTR